MAGSPKKRERRQRTEALFADPASLDMLCGRIAAGETLAAISRELDIKFRDLTGWLEGDADRRKRYKAALDVRDQHHKDHVVDEMMNLLKIDITEAFKPDGTLKAIEDMPEGVRKFIAGIENEELFEGKGENRQHVGTLRKVRFWDKVRGMELMAKHLKMLVEKHEHSGKITLADLLSEEPKP